MSIKKSILLRVRVVFIVMLLFSSAIIYKIIDVQYLNSEVWKAASERYSARIKKVKAVRGNIYADDGSLLATSAPRYKVAFDPTRYWKYIENVKKDTTEEGRIQCYKDSLTALSKELALFFGDKSYLEYFNEIEENRNKKRSYMRISRQKINYHEKKQMEQWTIFNKGRHRGGVIFTQENNRLVPFNYLARRTIGYTKERLNKNKKKVYYGAGLEWTFDSLLAGKDGQALYRNVGQGVWIPSNSEHEVKPVNGYDLHTTLNVNLQDVVEHSLLGALEQYSAKYGCAIVMEVETGEIKAIANLSRKERGEGNNKKVSYVEDYNYAVGRSVEPGSTFKLASLLALFEDTDIALTDTIDAGNGFYDFSSNGKAVMTDSKSGGYGKITIQRGVEVSSNILISKLVNEHFGANASARQRYLNYLDKFQVTKDLSFEIKGSSAPTIKEVKDWSPTTLPWMSIGYETQMTPLQILTLYAGLANNGKILKPTLIKQVTNAGEVIQEFEPTVLQEKICDDSTLKKVTTCLEGVVKNGTARRTVYNPAYRIAGKTGTSQKLVNGKYQKDKHYTSFAGYFPVEKPKYACIVVVDEPHTAEGKSLYGGQAAGPVFRKISDYLYKSDLELHHSLPKNFRVREGVFPVVQTGYYEDLGMISDTFALPHAYYDSPTGQKRDLWVVARRNDETKKIEWSPRTAQKGRIPNVKGMTLRDALYLLENLGLNVEFTGHGRVVKQSQPANSRLLSGSTIKIELK
ncbi:MAG: transpeptidase family protein [Cytophagales bacterium]|nr:transpeptidase family protein [Cytophagales bacterium]